ncbi:MAG TPA: NDP-sugar synthase [Dehalococcoidia bacterium]|nr:NDP-sugar synthase [Dehalococcoidia bacterium]
MNDISGNKLPKTKAVILVGGPGTRLQPLTDSIPKSLVPVLNRPFMEHTFAYLKHYGVKDIALTLNYLPDTIKDHFGDGRRFGVNLSYYIEEEPLGTAGAVKNAGEFLDNTFVVLNGDVFTDIDLADMLTFHRRNNAAATISLKWVDDTSAFGVVETDDTGRVRRFIEKPPASEATTNWINAGIYILEPDVLEMVPSNTHYMFERGLFPGLLDAGKRVFGYEFRGYWMDTGTLEYYFSLNNDLLLSKTGSPLLGKLDAATVYYESDDVDIDPSSVIIPPAIIGRGCRIGSGAVITGPAVIGPDSSLEEGASVTNAVIWDKVRIGSKARLSRCIISSGVDIAPDGDIAGCAVTPSKTKSIFIHS